ncbi:hypothetical protein T492DRAFT_1134952 [Pavlovales sp. CCMP2436]|nr:hypothetical protein T492DRAFT_1134952 [Pavlovales sp. CCMP2436]
MTSTTSSAAVLELACTTRSRKYAAGLARTASERQKLVVEGGKGSTHAATRLIGMLKEHLGNEHSVLGLYFGDHADIRRAELGQTFWNTLMLVGGRVGAVLLGKEGPLGVRRTHQRRLLGGAPDAEDGLPSKGAGAATVTPEIRQDEDVRRMSGSVRGFRQHSGYALETIEHRLDDETIGALQTKFTRYSTHHMHCNTNGLRMIPCDTFKDITLMNRDRSRLLSCGGLRRLAEKLDRSGEGRISFGEFVMWFDLQVQDAFEREERGAHGWRKIVARFTLPAGAKLGAA